MAGIFTKIDDAISRAIKSFKGKKAAPEVKLPQEIDQQRKAIELAQDFGFLSEEQTGTILTARDIARALCNSEMMGVPQGQISEALKMLHDSIESSGTLFGRKNAEKSALALGMTLAANLNVKAAKRYEQAAEYEKKAEEMKAAGKEDTASVYLQKAEESREKAEGFRSTAYWYLGTTPDSADVSQNKYNKNAEGPKYLRKLVLENKPLLLSMISSIAEGAKPDLGDLFAMSGYLSKDSAMSAAIADSIFAVKSALRVDGLVKEMPDSVSDFKLFVATNTLPIEKTTPGRLGNKPVLEMAEAMRDLMSARLNQLAGSDMDEKRYTEVRENASSLKKAVWSVVLGHIAENGAKNDLRVAAMGGVLAKNYVNDLMPPEDAVKIINEMSLKMSAGLLLGRLESDEAFKNAKDAKTVEQAIFAAEENALKSQDDSISKIFALAQNARLDNKDLIAAVVEAKLGKKVEAPAKEVEGKTAEAQAEVQVDAEKKKGKSGPQEESAGVQADAEKKKGKGGPQEESAEQSKKKKEGLPELPVEVQNLAGMAANENQVGATK